MDPFSPAPKVTVWHMPRPASLQNQTLMVADDDRHACESAAQVLRGAGFEVLTAYSGQEALQVVQAAQPAVAILDLSMRFGSGWDTATTLRQEAPEMLLIAHTGFSTLSEWQQAESCGFDAYFVKPCDHDRLIELIREYLQPRRLSL
ncbi:MAG: response regulator [Paraburkholderia sp.]|jgi:DNA-binding NtrC family response regulator|uniref:response regulator n=1 Tax=Burkholderiaceae TaxID=119060 RepID=UPI0014850694|nr:response regulator [Burkholderia sp. 4M9327F10]